MQLLLPISVTQSTAPSANASTAANASAWTDALGSTQPAPQSSAPPPAMAPASPNQTADNNKAPNDSSAAPTPDANGPAVQLNKTTKAAKPELVDAMAQPSKDAKKATQQTAVVVATGMPTLPVQPAPEKLAAPVNEKPPGDGLLQTSHTASVAANTANAANTVTSNQTLPNRNDTPPKPGVEISTAPANPVAAPAHIATKAQPLAPAAPPANNAQPGVAELASVTTSGARDNAATLQSAGTTSAGKAAMQPSASQPANQPVATSTAQALTARTTLQSAGTTTGGKAAMQPSANQPASQPANQPAATSTAQALTARATQLSETMTVLPKEKAKSNTSAVTALGGASATGAEFSVSAAGNTTTQTTARVESTGTAPAALAATVTALHQSGQTGTVLRLDPPGLGHLSVEVRLSAQGQVNVMFVPSTADAAQALQASLPGLGSAMAQSGLTLGQAQVGGQFSQQSGQNGQSGYTPPRQNNADTFAAEPQTTPSGLSAYA